MRTTRVLNALAVLLVLAVPAFAQSHGSGYRHYPERESELRLRLGAFQPDGDSEYWRDVHDQFTGSIDDFENVEFGGEYLLPLGSHFSLSFGGSIYEGDSTQAYRRFLDNDNNRIRHDTTLDIAAGTFGVVYHILAPDVFLQPYVGGGGGTYWWQIEESGDFIDFGSAQRPIFNANLKSDGVAFGYYWLAGLQAPITRHVSLYAEGRWTVVKDNLSGDFEGFGDIDLGGREFAAGVSWRL
jgi:opacity protein-like surface antigen